MICHSAHFDDYMGYLILRRKKFKTHAKTKFLPVFNGQNNNESRCNLFVKYNNGLHTLERTKSLSTISRSRRRNLKQWNPDAEKKLRNFSLSKWSKVYNLIWYTFSLTGSYVMHDMLPWDDDLDILIHNDSKAKVIHLFKDDRHYGIQGYMNKYQMGRVIKLFFTDSEPTVNRVWNWPFLDVETYIEEGDQIRLAHRSDVERIYWPKSAYFPFHRRPFGPLWLYFPHDPAIYFKIHYNHPFYCQRHFKDHRHENWQKVIKADCERLTPHYPFVRRSPFANITQETLLLNGTELYTVYISEPYSKPKSKLGW